MIVDSSALVAILLEEPEARRLGQAILSAPSRRISAFNWLESMVVAERRKGAIGTSEMLANISLLHIESVATDPRQMVAAYEAWRRFGKGRHPAALNLGDCCAYAASVTLGEPLLFKGTDFSHTDVAVAPW